MTASSFTSRVHAIVASIPKGRVATYGQVAKAAGNAKASRAVGMAMSRNRDPKAVPCHRVVSSTGALTGYGMGKGIITKKSILKKEGVLFTGEKVNLEASGWKG